MVFKVSIKYDWNVPYIDTRLGWIPFRLQHGTNQKTTTDSVDVGKGGRPYLYLPLSVGTQNLK
jgi:hypothetical protein